MKIKAIKLNKIEITYNHGKSIIVQLKAQYTNAFLSGTISVFAKRYSGISLLSGRMMKR